MSAPFPSDDHELGRVHALHGYRVLDTPPEPCFERLASMAAELCEAPVAVISLVDAERQWFKARVGVEVSELPRSVSFCAHAIADPLEPMVVPDATRDVRFRENPLVTGGPRIRFYAGAPLVVASGHALGTLCVLDYVPRELTARQRASLLALARVVVRFLERRRAAATSYAAAMN